MARKLQSLVSGFVVGLVAGNKKERRTGTKRRSLLVEQLEDRALLAAGVLPKALPPVLDVHGQSVAKQTIVSGGECIGVAQFTIADKAKPSAVPTISRFDTLQVSVLSSVTNPIQGGDLYGDLDPDVPGYETLVASAGCVNGKMCFTAIADPTLYFPGQKGAYLIIATPGTYVSEANASVAFNVDAVGMVNVLSGQAIPSSQVGYSGTTTWTHTLKAAKQTLTIGVDGPSSQQFAIGDHHVFLANETFDTQAPVLVKSTSVVIWGQTAMGGPLSHMIDTSLTSVTMHDIVTGQTATGVLIASGSKGVGSYAAYSFGNFTLPAGHSTWQVVVDTINNRSMDDGERLTALFSAESGSKKCDFGGRLLATTEFNTVAINQTTGKTIPVTGPGGYWAGNEQTFGWQHLYVSELATTAANTAVANQRNITLERFAIYAQGGDALLTQVHFASAMGDLHNVVNPRLWWDSNNDGRVDVMVATGIITANPYMVFTNIVNGGLVLLNQSQNIFEVHVDAASSFSADPRLQLTESYVEAENLTGGDGLFPEQMPVVHAPQTVVSFVSNGDLYVTKDVTPVPSRLVLGDQLSDVLARYRLRATNEPADVTKLAFEMSTAEARSIDRLQLYVEGATTPFAYATIPNTGSDPIPSGKVAFTARMQSQQLVVPCNGEVVVLVRAFIKGDYNGGVSGDTFTINTNPDARMDTVVGYGAVQARGVNSSNTYKGNDGDPFAKGEVFIGTNVPATNTAIVSATHTVTMSKVTSAANANPDSNGTSITTGTTMFGQWSLVAAANTNASYGLNAVSLDNVVILVTAQNVLLDTQGFWFSNKGNPSQRVHGVVTDTDGNAWGVPTVTGTFLVKVNSLTTSAVDAQLHSGESKTFGLTGTVLNPRLNAAVDSVLTSGLELTLDWLDSDAFTSHRFHGLGLADTLAQSTVYRN